MAFTYDPATVNAATVEMWRQAGLNPQPFTGSNFQNPSAGDMTTASNLQSPQNYYNTTYANSPSVTAQRVGANDNVQPANTLQQLSQATPQWVLDAQAAGSGGGHSTGPPPGSVPIPGQPGAYVTRSGQTWGAGRPEGMDYDTWLKRNQDALKAAIQQQTPEATAYVRHMNANQLPIGYANPQTETDYLTTIGLNPLGSGYLGSSAGANYFTNAGIQANPATQGLGGTNFAASIAAAQAQQQQMLQAQQAEEAAQQAHKRQLEQQQSGLTPHPYQGSTAYTLNQTGPSQSALDQSQQQYFLMLSNNYGPEFAAQIMGLPPGYRPSQSVSQFTQPGAATQMQEMALRAAANQYPPSYYVQEPQTGGPDYGGYGTFQATGPQQPPPSYYQQPPPQQPPPSQQWVPDSYTHPQRVFSSQQSQQDYQAPSNVPQPYSSGGTGAGNPTPSVGTPQTLRWSAAGNNINTGRQSASNRASIYGGMPGSNTYLSPGQNYYRYQG